jgi:hypothetical protein
MASQGELKRLHVIRKIAEEGDQASGGRRDSLPWFAADPEDRKASKSGGGQRDHPSISGEILQLGISR